MRMIGSRIIERGKKILLLALFFTPMLYAQQPEKEGSEQSEQKGNYQFNGPFLRLQSGLGQIYSFRLRHYAEAQQVPYYDDYHFDTTSREAWNFNLQAGYLFAKRSLPERPLLSGSPLLYMGFSMIQTKLKQDRQLARIARAGSARYKLPMLTTGGGIFFANLGAYVSAELRFKLDAVRFSYQYERASDGSQVEQNFKAFGVGISLGKDWWISSHLLLGVALIFYHDTFESEKAVIRNPQYGRQTIERPIDGHASYLGLALSVTVN